MSAPSVRAKFFVSDIRHSEVPGADPYALVTLMPVYGSYGDGKDNESWSRWTPSGQVQMSITNPKAIDAFEKGKAYYLDFTPVE
ncbi:hypothetical protein [Rhizobium sp. CSW-27]|uniref:hypothetical protein n=1 Tax=Rhizobium sp. CSW-27 TaxID=2839985 RepID=UPI001C01111B|nr:hypothetical protein [Rhizobium sp. CSW-27]MBT9370288.1 hypothetical protein [Rhizobium sp. CSW-27]